MNKRLSMAGGKSQNHSDSMRRSVLFLVVALSVAALQWFIQSAEGQSPVATKLEADTEITNLMKGHTSDKEEQRILSIFKGWKGADLTRLKKAVDHGGDYRDLQQLVVHDIDAKGIREELLKHFEEEGKLARAALEKLPVNVFSDIDDTFYQNWKDKRYPPKTPYPGVRQFYLELDKGGTDEEDALGDLVFLSARPYDRGGVNKSLVFETLKERGVNDPTILLGHLKEFLTADDERIAEVKFENWKQYCKLYPEYDSVLIGDSGQGDAIFGKDALDEENTNVKAVFIHKVTNLDDKKLKAAKRFAFRDKRIHYFDTYVGAATEAFKRGLITKEGLQRVADAAKVELAKVLPLATPEQKAKLEEIFKHDLDAMDAVPQ